MQILGAHTIRSSGHVCFFRQQTAVTLQILAIPFDILHQQIFARQLIAIGKMIDHLVVVHAIAIVNAENTATRIHAGPKEVPVLFGVHLGPVAFLEVIHQHRFVQIGAIGDAALVMGGRYNSGGQKSVVEKLLIAVLKLATKSPHTNVVIYLPYMLAKLVVTLLSPVAIIIIMYAIIIGLRTKLTRLPAQRAERFKNISPLLGRIQNKTQNIFGACVIWSICEVNK